MYDRLELPVRLVYLSPVPLGSFSQRPHHFVRWFHERFGAEVLWVDPYPTRMPRASDLRRIWNQSLSGLGPDWASESWIRCISVPAIPFEPITAGRRANGWMWRNVLREIEAFVSNGAWIVGAKPSMLALALRRQLAGCPFAFDVLDNTPAFSRGLSKRWMESIEQQLANEADWIITSSTPLFDKFMRIWPDKTRIARNGLTVVPRQYPKPVPSTATPVLGFVGAIASWFDWDAVIKLARTNVNATVLLVGPCEKAPKRLPGNIRLAPAVPHTQVYDVMSSFTAGLIPFACNSLTEFVDPIKFYEYRALGLPVLSTRFGEMRYRDISDGVHFLEEPFDLRSLLAADAPGAELDDLRCFQQENSWAARFDALDFFDA